MTSVAIPVLPMRSLDETLRFYGALGFSIDFEEREPSAYAILSFDDAELHFAAASAGSPASGAAYLRVESADAIHRTWSEIGLPAAGAPSLGPIGDLETGMREFGLVDPAGNRLRVGHRLD